MRSVKAILAAGLLGATPSLAQVHLQKYSLDRLSFQYRSTSEAARARCLVWKPLADNLRPTLRYNDDGEPFLRVPVSAVLQDPRCPIKVVSKTGELEEDKEAQVAGERHYVATVRPPVTIITVEGPDFVDELLFEAPVRAFEGATFFEFFRRSKVYFESRYAQFRTTNPVTPLEGAVSMFPVFGGNIAVPIPGVDFLFAGFSMFQNLGSFGGNEAVGLQYSEFALDLRATWRGRESWGVPSLGVMGEFRGRNVYQLGSQRSFVVTAAALPYIGFEASWFPAAFFLPWDHWASRIGIEGAGHLPIQSWIGSYGFSSSFYEGVVNYRLTKEWALGVGYSVINQSADFTALDPALGIVRDSAKNYFLRLTLLPVNKGAVRP